jgi:Flp pilus assembly pilin Flp
MPINSPAATQRSKNRFVASVIEYGLIAILAAAAMTAGFNVLLGASL